LEVETMSAEYESWLAAAMQARDSLELEPYHVGGGVWAVRQIDTRPLFTIIRGEDGDWTEIQVQHGSMPALILSRGGNCPADLLLEHMERRGMRAQLIELKEIEHNV
jgi:hypothetical protein